MGFLSHKDSGENTLVLEISSGSTAAALVHTHEHGLPEILATVRTPFLLAGEPNSEALEGAMLASLRNTLATISRKVANLGEKGYGRSLSRALVSFSSPWITSNLKTVIMSKEQGFIFDKTMMNTVIEEEKELFLSRLKDSYSEESEIIETTVTNLYLNGYEAKSVVDEKVKKVEVSFLISAAPKALREKIDAEIAKSMHIKHGAALHSFIYVFYKVLSHSFQNIHSALLINMTHEVTDVLFLRHGNSALSASLPFGPGSIARAAAERLNIPEEIAYSYLTLFASGVFDTTTTDAIDKVLLEIEDKWRSLWKNMGESIPEGESVPYSVFLIVPEGYEKLIKTFLEGVFGNRKIILLGETNTFTKELVKAEPDAIADESLMVLSSFSNLIN